MENIAKRLNACITAHPFDTVVDQLYQAYAESHKPEIQDGFKELDNLL